MALPVGGWGQLAGNHAQAEVQSERGWISAGLTYKVHDKGTIQVTGGSAGTDTFTPKIDGVSIVSSAVAWTSSHNATASAIANAINANLANNVANGLYVMAVVSTDTVTVHAMRAEALGTLTCTIAASATATVVDFTGFTDTAVEIFAGSTSVPTGNLLTLAWNSSLAYLDTDMANAVITRLYPQPANAFEFFSGIVGAPATAGSAPAGMTYATTELRGIPWLGAAQSLVVYPSGAGVWDYVMAAV